eukprot:Nk52_evm7s367 gene=Nk52_evmTU7s367
MSEEGGGGGGRSRGDGAAAPPEYEYFQDKKGMVSVFVLGKEQQQTVKRVVNEGGARREAGEVLGRVLQGCKRERGEVSLSQGRLEIGGGAGGGGVRGVVGSIVGLVKKKEGGGGRRVVPLREGVVFRHRVGTGGGGKEGAEREEEVVHVSVLGGSVHVVFGVGSGEGARREAEEWVQVIGSAIEKVQQAHDEKEDKQVDRYGKGLQRSLHKDKDLK